MKNKKPQKQMNKAGENFLLKEYEALWHLIDQQEANSDRYIKFYFTLLLALAAAGGALIKLEKTTADKQIASILPDIIKTLTAPAVVIVFLGTIIFVMLSHNRKKMLNISVQSTKYDSILKKKPF